jgi:isopenicillin N synthase-like dioxygenase
VLPIVDVSPFLSPRVTDVAALSRAAATLRAACEDSGFFYATGHGVPAELMARLDRVTRAFFALPEAVKREVAMERGGRAWRGWFPVGGELTSGRPDRKEGLYFGAELPPTDPRPLHGPNLFPAAVPAMRDTVLAWMAAMETLGHAVMRGIAASLALPEEHFASGLTERPLGLFRIFHYPADVAGDPAEWGVGEHTDYGLLTLLLQDDCGGLEVKTSRGWVAAPPVPGTFVCNLGDMLDRLTGGRYRSTPHRVRNVSGRSRFSWPFFFDPTWEAAVEPLPFARVRPADVDAAERWDRASVHTLRGTYGEYLLSKVARVFPELGRDVLPPPS